MGAQMLVNSGTSKGRWQAVAICGWPIPTCGQTWPEVQRPPRLSSQTPLAVGSNRLVHGVRGQVDLTWPSHKAVDNVDLRKQRRIRQRSEYASEMGFRHSDGSAHPISEEHNKAKRLIGLDFDDVGVHLDLTATVQLR